MIQKIIAYTAIFAVALSPAFSDSAIESKLDKSQDAPVVMDEVEDRVAQVDDYLENPLLRLQSGSQYSSEDYSKIARELAVRYPEIISYETIGYSHDGKEIYSLVMTEGIKDARTRDDYKTFRMHYLIEAGIHGRETVNPAILLKQVEDYAADYYRDSHIKDFSLRDILSKSVFHFIPLVNPDGHDLSKFGSDSVFTESVKSILFAIDDNDYSQWKANVYGVDLNKNFPDFYLEDGMIELTDKWQKYPGDFYSIQPDGEYYPGSHAGSEPETQALMNYMESFDFRSYASYHSRGNVVYYEYRWYPDQYRDKALELAQRTREVTGYRLLPDTGSGSGYSTSYHVALSLKPSLTIETLPFDTLLPSGNSSYLEAYEQTRLLPLHYQELGEKTGYFPFRLYVDGKYVRDFPDKAYANAIAKSSGGIIVEGDGIPESSIND